MLFWCTVIIIIGVVAILQDCGFIASINAPCCSLTWAIMLVALGILVRMRNKQVNAEKERLKAQIGELQRELDQK